MTLGMNLMCHHGRSWTSISERLSPAPQINTYARPPLPPHSVALILSERLVGWDIQTPMT